MTANICIDTTGITLTNIHQHSHCPLQICANLMTNGGIDPTQRLGSQRGEAGLYPRLPDLVATHRGA
jgi:hypothetical protein